MPIEPESTASAEAADDARRSESRQHKYMGMICVGAAAMVYAESGSAKWIAMAMVGLIWGVEVGEFLRKLVRERRKWPA